MRKNLDVAGRTCILYENDEANVCLIQPVDEHDLQALDGEVEWIKLLAPQTPFMLAAFLIKDWNDELSPWTAPAVFGNQAFGAGANRTLSFIEEALLQKLGETIKHDRPVTYYMGGYSLAGLFSLWAGYQTEGLSGVAAVSPSVWFPGWDDYAQTHAMRTPAVYLSLGDREEKTRNKTMAAVGERIRGQHELLQKADAVKHCALEWNPGNHFVDVDIRMAKGFAWLLNNTLNEQPRDLTE